MRKPNRALSLHFAILLTALTVSDRLAAEATLGRFPLCEASSALLVTCPGGRASVFWSATTNRQRNCTCSPFGTKNSIPTHNALLACTSGTAREISDIEALAGISGDEILVFASHSRNTSCEVKPKRRQFGKVSLSKAQTAVVGTLRSQKVTCEHVFDNRGLDAPMKAACEAIDIADAKAAQIDDAMKAGKFTEDVAKDRCNAVNAYNAKALSLSTHSKGQMCGSGCAPHYCQHTTLNPIKSIWPSCST